MFTWVDVALGVLAGGSVTAIWLSWWFARMTAAQDAELREVLRSWARDRESLGKIIEDLQRKAGQGA